MSQLDLELAGLERQLHQALQNAIQGELAAAGLQEVGHPMLLCVLGGVGQRPEASLHTQRELAQLLNVSPAAVTNSLNSLERKGYISRRSGAGDARCNQVCLTDKGRRAVEACVDCPGGGAGSLPRPLPANAGQPQLLSPGGVFVRITVPARPVFLFFGNAWGVVRSFPLSSQFFPLFHYKGRLGPARSALCRPGFP